MNRKDVAIVGMGCAFPRAANVQEFWRINANGVDCIEPVPSHRLPFAHNWNLPPEHTAYLQPHRGGFLPKDLGIDPVKFGVLPNIIRHGDADQFLMLYVIDQALQDARLAADDPRRQRTDIIVGRGNYPTPKSIEITLRVEYLETVLELIERRHPQVFRGGLRQDIEQFLISTLPPSEADSLSTAISNITASRAANRLNCNGSAHCVDGACASAIIAIEQGLDRLRSGKADYVVASGFFLTQTTPFLHVFSKLGAVSPSGVIRPMDRRADGLVVGEGAGAVVLKRLEDAVADGDQVYCVIRGAGTASDGREVDVLAPASKGQVLALERAYADADVDPATISFLEIHGTGTVVGDLTELHTIKTFYGTSKHPPTSRAMASVKSLVGHCMPASGMASVIRTALAVSNKVLPPSLHCEEPREELRDSPFYVNAHTRPWVQNDAHGPRRAGVNSFGFGGINGHLILEEVRATPGKRRTKVAVPRPIEPGVDRPTELALFSAADVPGLSTQLATLLNFLTEDRQEKTPADIAFSLAQQIDCKHAVKLAIVYAALDELTEKIRKVQAALAAGAQPSASGNLGNDETIYYATDAAKPPGKVAFIFPGMGFPGLIGNYPDHLLELCLHYPELRAEFDFFEDRDRNPQDDIPTSAVFVPPSTLPEEYRLKLKNRLAPPKAGETMASDAPEERYLAGMGVTLANWISWTLMKQFQMRVEMATGQSQGEMAAVCAVGMADFHETAPLYWRVLNANPRYTGAGQLGFAWATEEQVLPFLAENPGVYIAMYMNPNALILGGDRDGVLRILDGLKKQQCLTQLLPYPPIHTPCMSFMWEELDQVMQGDQFTIQKGHIQLYSSITAEPYPDDPEGVRQTLMLNLDHPLRVWQTIQRMYRDGARVFVQVGGGHMASQMKELLPPGAQVKTVALDTDTRNPLTQLNHLIGGTFTFGVAMKVDALFTHRRVRQLDLTTPRGEAPKPKMYMPFRLEWSPLAHPVVPPRAAAAADTQPAAPTSAPTPGAAAQPATTTAPSPAAPPAAAVAETPVPAPPADDLELAPAVVEFQTALPVLINAHIVRYVPDQELLIERLLDVDEDLYLHDHLFVYAPCKRPQDCLPIVPLTMSLEFTAEAAALLCPGRGLIGYENVRAMRWIGLEDKPRAKIAIEAKVVSDDEATGVRKVEVTIIGEGKRSLGARLAFGAEYRQEIDLQWPDYSQDPPWPVETYEIYNNRRMFHGPRFHVVSKLGTFTNPLCTGFLRMLPRNELFRSQPQPELLVDPCVLDGIGQYVGLWCQMFGWFVLPTGVERIEIYGPTPPVGTEIELRMVITQFDMDTKMLRCNVELSDGQGGVWMRLLNWGDWIFKWTPEFLAWEQDPHRALLTDELSPPGLAGDMACVRLHEKSLQAAETTWVARLALTLPEFAEFQALPDSKSQKRFLVSRVCAKEAVRQWLRNQGIERISHPAEFQIQHDEFGKPLVVGFPHPTVPEISVAHKDSLVVALAASFPVGIDLELRSQDTRSLLPTFATEDEIALLNELSAAVPDGVWETRLWSAKEAAGKVRGTGLNGLPKRLRLVEADADGRMVIQDTDTGAQYEVYTSLLEDEHVIAIAALLGAVQASGGPGGEGASQDLAA